MRIGIDLLWVRVGKCGGTESYVRNLIDGFADAGSDNEFILFAASDNADSFKKYCVKNPKISISECNVRSEDRIKRIAWENLHLDNKAKKLYVDVMFVPVYSMPHRNRKNGIPYVTVIHDLQGLHYPEYFSIVRLAFLKRKWSYSTLNAAGIIATTEYTAADIVKNYPTSQDKMHVIYIPVSVRKETDSDILSRLHLKEGEYFYCVSSLLPHKNLSTLLSVMAYRAELGLASEKLVISGVGGNSKEFLSFQKQIEALGITDNVVLTGYVTDEDRDALYRGCKVFLFPSVFEGFGMPPIEAQMLGIPVITTEKTSLKEVTQNRAIYVENPYDPAEWSDKIDTIGSQTNEETTIDFSPFCLTKIADSYIQVFTEILSDKKSKESTK